MLPENKQVASRINSSHKKETNSRSDNATWTNEFLLKKFEDMMNQAFSDRDYYGPNTYHTFYIVSRSWLGEWKRHLKESDREKPGTINADFIHPNPYKLEEKIIVEGPKYTLVNNIDLCYEYDIVSDNAWKLLASRYDAISIKKAFYIDERGDYYDTLRLLSLNVVFVDSENKIYSFLMEIQDTKQTQRVTSQLTKYFGFEPEDYELYLLDTRQELSTLLTNLKNKKVLGRVLPMDNQFSFKHLKNFEVICLVNKTDKYTINMPQEENGFCYHCRRLANLSYHCVCQIASYCSIDCKYKDYLAHKFICPQVIDVAQDVETDLKNYQNITPNNGELGLSNIGNSCYLNCILQVLKTVSPVVEEINASTLDDYKGSDLLATMYHLFKKLQVVHGQSLKPWPFKIALGLQSNAYLYYAQNDASECLDAIINVFDEAQNPKVKHVSDCFKGSFVNKFTCQGCGKVKLQKNEEAFFLLPLSLIPEQKAVSFPYFYCNLETNLFELSPRRISIFDQNSIVEKVMEEALKERDLVNPVLALVDRNQVLEYYFYDESFGNFRRKGEVYYRKENLILFDNLFKDKVYINMSVAEKYLNGENESHYRKLCNTRILPIDESLIVASGHKILLTDLHLTIFNYLYKIILAQHLDLETLYKNLKDSKKHRLLKIFYAELMGIELSEEKSKNTSPIKNYEGYKSKLVTKQEKTEDLVQDKEAEDRVKKTIQNRSNLFYRINYVNRSEICQNCGYEGRHICDLEFSSKKYLSLNKGGILSIDLSIEITEKSPIFEDLKIMTEPERTQQAKYENFRYTSVHYTVRNSLAAFFEAQNIERKCKHCNSSESTMAASIKKFPPFLIIHLKRFTSQYENGRVVQSKIEEFVDFDFEVQFDEQHHYSLMGVINHRGNLDGGHYTSFARRPSDGAWFYYDDTHYEQVTDLETIKSRDNYILFYRLT